MTRRLPIWQDAWSDGCSIPPALRPFFPDTPAVRACCVRHDERYYYGGSRAHRFAADVRFAVDLLDVGVPAETAEKMYVGVRVFGGPSGRIPGVSWAFGGEVFAYTDAPAVPAGA